MKKPRTSFSALLKISLSARIVTIVLCILMFFLSCATPKDKELKYVKDLCSTKPMVGTLEGAKAEIEAKRHKLESFKLGIGIQKYSRSSQELDNYSVEWEMLNKSVQLACKAWALCQYRSGESDNACIKEWDKMQECQEAARNFFIKVKRLEFEPHGPALLEAAVIDIKHKIESIRGTYERTFQYEPKSGAWQAAIDKVRQTAPNLAGQLSALSEREMDLAYRIVKHEYSSYGYVLASSVERNRRERLIYANQAVLHGRNALKLIDEAKDKASAGGDKARRLLSYIERDDKTNRIHYLMAMALSIKGRDGNGTTISDVEREWNAIKSLYLEKYPPVLPQLKWAIEQIQQGE